MLLAAAVCSVIAFIALAAAACSAIAFVMLLAAAVCSVIAFIALLAAATCSAINAATPLDSAACSAIATAAFLAIEATACSATKEARMELPTASKCFRSSAACHEALARGSPKLTAGVGMRVDVGAETDCATPVKKGTTVGNRSLFCSDVVAAVML